MSIMRRFLSLFKPPIPIPPAYRSNFRHYFIEVGWWGVLTGSTAAFIAIYATRLGAAGWQVALITALPAAANLMLTIPSGNWMVGKSIDRVVFWTSVLGRVFYALMIPLPWIFLNHTDEIWALLLITFVMSLPAPMLTVAFNTMFADTVPDEWRSYVAGIRNAALALMTTLATLICGWVLVITPFPMGYQIVFGIGFLGGMMSSFHLYFIRPYHPYQPRINKQEITSRLNGFKRIFSSKKMRFDVLEGHFGRVILLLFFFHLAQYMAIPVFPLFQVNNLHLSDDIIGLGSALFNFMVFMGSTQLYRISHRFNFKEVTGIGVIGLGLYPALMTISQSVWMYSITSLLGGAAWALAGGALYNYLAEKVPQDDRPAHMAWYNLALNAAILLGSVIGAEIGNQISLGAALLLFAGTRAIAGLAILRWG